MSSATPAWLARTGAGLLLGAGALLVAGCLASARVDADRAFDQGDLMTATRLYERLEGRRRVDADLRFRLAVLYSLDGPQHDPALAARQLRALVARAPQSPLGRAASLWLAREHELEALRTAQTAAAARIDLLTRQVAQLEAEAESLSRRVASEYEGRRKVQAARAAAASALERERERIASLEARVAELESELARLKAIDLDTPPQ